MSELQKQGYQILSTSQELDWIVIDRYNLPRYFIEVLRNKEDKVLQDYLKDESITCRSIKISTAENWFIPQLGRKGLIERTMKNQYNPNYSEGYRYNKDLVFFETIGGVEAELARQAWQPYGCSLNVNLRGDRELAGVDIRQLAKYGLEVTNDYFSPTQLFLDFMRAVDNELDDSDYDPDYLNNMYYARLDAM
ncbi:hypothetical protein ACLFKQ_22300 [Myxosarcina sp. GI1(2024)]